MNYFILLIGFFLLIKGADWFVSGASDLAKLLRVPSVIIGLTIVAMGTSAPELSVSITGSLGGQSGISVGNVIGSNLFNLLCVGGLSAMIRPMTVNHELLKRDIPISLAAAVLFFITAINGYLARWEGALFLALFALFLALMLRDALRFRSTAKEDSSDVKLGKSLVFIVLGLLGVILGGNLVVDSATKIALNFGLSDSLVGLTVVALGTSLPELVTSLVAAKKGENDIAMGNIIGSNIFNIGLVLGTTTVIHPMNVARFVTVDDLYLCGVTLLLLFFVLRDKKLSRGQGTVLFLLYFPYLVYIFLRG
ncbi:MAG: calcium/sodium antiporter [Bacillota bacterium]|nr:calcium/sodium antiporter [Bacillota bacterium]